MLELGQLAVERAQTAEVAKALSDAIAKFSEAATRTRTPRNKAGKPTGTDDSLPLPLDLADQAAVLRRTLNQGEEVARAVRAERLRQARLSFRITIALAVTGLVVVGAGLILMLFSLIGAGSILTAVGAISQLCVLVALRINRDANDRLDRLAFDLTLLESIRISTSLVGEISDPAERDQAIRCLINSIGQPAITPKRAESASPTKEGA